MRRDAVIPRPARIDAVSLANGDHPPDLHAASEKALAYLRQQFQAGFTGTIIITCNNGGVRSLEQQQLFNAVDLNTGPEKPRARIAG
jgi:hypothetical protein